MNNLNSAEIGWSSTPLYILWRRVRHITEIKLWVMVIYFLWWTSPYESWRCHRHDSYAAFHRKNKNEGIQIKPHKLFFLIYKQNITVHWRHNDHDGVSNHQPHGCLLNRLFRRRWKKTWKLRVTGLCAGNSQGPMNSPHKGPVTRNKFPIDDVIMICTGFSWRHIAV